MEPTEPTEKRTTKKRKREGGGPSGEGAVERPDAELERMRLELERQKLELEKAKLDLERQKLELESQARPAKSPRRASGEKPVDPLRKSGEKPVDPRRKSGEKPRPASSEPSEPDAPAAAPRKVDTGRGLAIAGVVGAVAAAATVFGAIHMLNTRGPLAPAPSPEVAVGPEGAVAIPTATATEPRQPRRVSDDASGARREQLATMLTRIEVELPDALPAVFTALLAQLEVVAADRALDDALRDRVRDARAAAERARHASATRGIVDARRHADAGRFREAVERLRDVEQLGLPLPPDVIVERDRWFAARLESEMGVTPPPTATPPPAPAPPAEPVAVAGGDVRPVSPDPNDWSPPTTTEASPADPDADADVEAEAEAPDAPAGPGVAEAAAVVATPEQLAAIERDVRDRVEDWFKLRTLRSIRCMRCDGTQRNRCSGCGGDGITEVIGVNGVFRETCDQCRGSGEIPCTDSLCQRGLRSLSIKRAFWDYLSPAWRKGRGHTELYRPLFEGGFAELIGPAIVVKSARIDRVDVRERDVLVVVTCEWDFYTSVQDERDELARRRIPTELTTRWVRVKNKFYLATDRDLEPERLR